MKPGKAWHYVCYLKKKKKRLNILKKKKNWLKNGEVSEVPLLNFEGVSGVPNLNLMGVPGPALIFEEVPKTWAPESCSYFYTMSGA